MPGPTRLPSPKQARLFQGLEKSTGKVPSLGKDSVRFLRRWRGKSNVWKNTPHGFYPWKIL
jgi:hypothetical protein